MPKPKYSLNYLLPIKKRPLPNPLDNENLIKIILNLPKPKHSLPKSKRPLPNFFDKEKLIKLYENIDNINIMMACFVADISGLRITEVCNLKDIDVNLEDGYIKVIQGKGKKDRIVKIVNPLWIPILRKWRSLRGNSEYFIPSLNENNRRLCSHILSEKHREYLKKAKLDDKRGKTKHGHSQPVYCFHTHRHSYATNLLRWGFDISMVQQQLGHSFVSTTMVYNELSTRHIEERAEKIFGSEKQNKIEIPQDVNKIEIQQGIIADPMQLLQLRLARGEITPRKYNEILATLKVGSEIKSEIGYIG